jgi:hypothetical protein
VVDVVIFSAIEVSQMVLLAIFKYTPFHSSPATPK